MRFSFSKYVILLLILVTICVAKRGGRGKSSARISSSNIGSHRTRSKPYYTRKYSKTGSIEHTSNFRSFVFGATSGYLMYSGGRHIIQDASQPILYENRTYYWGETKYVPNENLPVQCVNKIDPQDPQFGKVYFENESSKPQEIMYGCPSGYNCCGYDCCPESTFFTSIFSLLILLLVLSVLGIFVIECIRWCLHCTYFCKHGRSRDFEPLSI
ncbi:unnamed protein product [Caenorhabditis angaria]|uniref:CX domain-containing protein n=1 Tax=Caenorhabditis angaria TaxID=860376 RepID=A0A9P1IJN3_9PELO|nr:unnamed protein product [Caenorhabditis angaria]